MMEVRTSDRDHGEIREDLDSLSKNFSGNAMGQLERVHSTLNAQAKSTIEAEKKAAIAELQASIADTSVDVAAKLIGNDLTEGEHRAIIEKYVKEAGSFNGN